MYFFQTHQFYSTGLCLSLFNSKHIEVLNIGSNGTGKAVLHFPFCVYKTYHSGLNYNNLEVTPCAGKKTPIFVNMITEG